MEKLRKMGTNKNIKTKRLDSNMESLYIRPRNSLMKNGNQNTAEKILGKAYMFTKIGKGKKVFQVEKTGKFLEMIYKAIGNVKPLCQVEGNVGGTSGGWNKRGRKAKAIAMPSRRGEKLAIE